MKFLRLILLFHFHLSFSNLSRSQTFSGMKVELWKLRKVAKRVATRIKSRRKQLGQGKHMRTVSRALSHYCTQTTLHGLRYVVDPNLHASERFLWLVVFATSTIVASNVIYTLALRFQVTCKRKGIARSFLCTVHNLAKPPLFAPSITSIDYHDLVTNVMSSIEWY